MSAVTFGDDTKDIDGLRLTHFEVPTAIGSHQVLLKTLATPVNPSDLLLIRGVYGAFPPKVKLAPNGPEEHVAGNEGVFEVTSVGNAVKGYSDGDWVLLVAGRPGSWRTHIVVDVPESGPDPFYKVRGALESGLTALQGASLSINPPTAYRLFHGYVTDWSPDGNDWIVQNAGASHVGQFLTQLARLHNVKVLLVIRGGKSNHNEVVQELKALGATEVITEEQAQSASFSTEELPKILGGGRVRLAVNCIGGALATALFLMLSPDGAMVTYGALTQDPITYPLRKQQYNNLSTHGFALMAEYKKDPSLKMKTLDAVVDLYKQGKLEVPRVETLEFKEGELHEWYLRAINSKGKSVVTYK